MEHIERMKQIRRHVDTIIAQAGALESLQRVPTPNVSVSFCVVPIGGASARDHTLLVPIDELRALIQRRIDDADAEIRKLGMVAPRPGAASLDRQPAPADLANPGT